MNDVQADGQRGQRTVSRRTVAAGAAWAAPVAVVATAAPAFAASPGCGFTLDWDSYTAGTTPANPVTIGGVSINRTIAYGAGTSGSANSGTVLAGPRGGINQNAFNIAMGTGANQVSLTDSMTLTFAFTPAVYNLQFSIYDIDRSNNAWKDNIVLTTGFTEVSRGALVTGSGTTLSPYTMTANSPQPNTSGSGNVTVNYVGPIGSLVITYYNNLEQGAQSMLVQVSDLTFCLRAA